jgi:hypothetical protein
LGGEVFLAASSTELEGLLLGALWQTLMEIEVKFTSIPFL